MFVRAWVRSPQSATIPTFFLVPATTCTCWSTCDGIIFRCRKLWIHTSAYSSVGRAGDCRWLQLISLGHWFDSGCADYFFFGCCLVSSWWKVHIHKSVTGLVARRGGTEVGFATSCESGGYTEDQFKAVTSQPDRAGIKKTAFAGN